MSAYEGMDPWEILGVKRSSSTEDIRAAWRELARKHHPDAGGEAEDFKRIQWAFEQIVGGAAGETSQKKNTRRTEQPVRDETVPLDGEIGERVMVETMVEHAVAVFGGTVRSTRWRLVHCPECSGSGLQCSTCNGDGRIGQYHESFVDIPPRSTHGDVLILRSEGDAGRRRRDSNGRAISNTGPYGDLEVRILVAREPWIVENGDDLIVDLHIDVYDAMLGVETRIRGLDGSYVLSVPAGVQPGQRLRVLGRGRPKLDSGRGDLVAVICVEIPHQLGVLEAETLRELRRGRELRKPPRIV